MPAALLKTIRGLGLSIPETVVFAVLLRGGSMFASRVARESRLNRTTCYGVLEELVEKGLVSKVKNRSATLFQSIEPELLPEYIAKRRIEMEAREQEVRDAIPEIKLLRSKNNVLPKVQFFEGKEGVEQAYEDTLENNQGKVLREITGLDAVYTKLDPKFVRYYIEKRNRLGIEARYITPDTPLARSMMLEDEKSKRVGKFIPSKYSLDTEFAIYDNKVGIFSFAKESPMALIIEDATIARAMQEIFTFIDDTIAGAAPESQ